MRIGERMVELGLVSEADVAEALRSQGQSGRRLASELVALGRVDEDAATRALAEHLSVPSARRKHFERADAGLLARVPARLAREHGVFPVGIVNGSQQELVLAMRDPGDQAAIEAVSFLAGVRIRPAVALATVLEEQLAARYPDTEPAVEPEPASDEELLDLAPLDPIPLPPPAAATRDPEVEPALTLDLAAGPRTAPADPLDLADPPAATPRAAPPPASPPSAAVSSLPRAEPVGARQAPRGAVVAVGVVALLGAWLIFGRGCHHREREIDIGGRSYYVEQVRMSIQTPVGWKYLPSEDQSQKMQGMEMHGASLYAGGNRDQPEKGLYLLRMQTHGRIPSELSDERFTQLVQNIRTASNRATAEMSLSLDDCQLTAAKVDQTGDCTGTAVYKSRAWNVHYYLWMFNGDILAAAFLETDPLEDAQPGIDDILASISPR